MLKQTISGILCSKKYVNAFSTTGVIGNQRLPVIPFVERGRAHNALLAERHHGAQIKFDFGTYDVPNSKAIPQLTVEFTMSYCFAVLRCTSRLY